MKCQYCGHKDHTGDERCGHRTPCSCGDPNCDAARVCRCRTISWENSEMAQTMANMTGDATYLKEPPV